MPAAGTAAGTAVGLTDDLPKGIIDRFRSLPMSRDAVLAGRTVADLVTNLIGLAVVAGAGAVVGWRIHNGAVPALGGFGLALRFADAMTWVGICLGIVYRSAEAAQATSFNFIFPLLFISNAPVATQGMAPWLRAVADWKPISARTASLRQPFGNPNPSARVHIWPMAHPELAIRLWSFAIRSVFVPLAIRLSRRHTAT